MWDFRVIICFAFLIINVFSYVKIDPLVSTNAGLIRGLRASDGEYSMFLGIPYGKVREDNPFAEAVSQTPFSDIFEAYYESEPCPQISRDNTIVGSLDCLSLNIYVPHSANSQNRLPVMFWIHGGRLNEGSSALSEFGPKFLVQHDVILVTINYRLAPYGFMCLDIPEVPGNQGFKDQLLALRWINQNIEAFGGDSSRISIFGESAGSMSIDFHLHAPYEKLFNNAILQSGTSLTPTFYEPVKNGPQLLAAYLGYETDDVNAAITYLSNQNTDSIILAWSALNLEFGPCVEESFENVESFITQNWINAPASKVTNMPVLIGFTSQEELIDYGPETYYYENLIRDIITVGFDIDDEAFDGMEEIVRQFYIGDEPISDNVRFDLIDLQSDFKFNYATYRTIKKYVENRAGNIFHYVFSYIGERNVAKIMFNRTDGGAAHSDELGYLFDTSMLTETPNAEDQLTIDRLTIMWTNFAKYSDPTPELSDILTTKWTPITRGSLHHYLDINSELSVKTRPYSNRMSFWDLFYKMNYDLQWIYPGNKVV